MLNGGQSFGVDITGKKFNHLTAICFDHVGDDKRHYWKFRCNCSNEIIAKKIYVMRGEVKSCGCISIAKAGSSEELEIKNYILSLNKNIKIEKTREILDGKKQTCTYLSIIQVLSLMEVCFMQQ